MGDAEDDGEEPEALCCPIGHTMMRDPVMLRSGHTFERENIISFWAHRPMANPIGSGDLLPSAQMIINYGMRSLVAAWLAAHPDVVPEGWESRDVGRLSTQADLDAIASEHESAFAQRQRCAEAAERQMLADAAPTVYLIGELTCCTAMDYLGAYDVSVDMIINARHVYIQRADARKMLWHADNGFWHAGPAADVGQNRGWLAVRDAALLPERITSQWQAGHGGALYEVQSLRCLAGDEGERAFQAQADMQRVAAAAELARAADVVYLDGETPEGLRQGWLGAYERIRDPPQLVHARHAYVKRGAPQKMLWHASNGYWHAGPAADLGEARGVLGAHDTALRPELIVAQWQVGYGDRWVAAPRLRCATQPYDAAAAADDETLPDASAPENIGPEDADIADPADPAALPAPAEDSAGSDALARALDDPLPRASEVVYLVGELPHAAPGASAVSSARAAEFFGAYDLRRSTARGQRHEYVQRGDRGKMLWFADNGFWHAGPAVDVGKCCGWLAVRDAATAPEDITATWQVNHAGVLSDAAGVRCLAGEEGERAYAAQRGAPGAPAGALAPATAPSNGSLAEKVRRVKRTLELDDGLPMLAAVERANEVVGREPEGPLHQQLDQLCSDLGLS